MINGLRNKRVLVTGASSGIGAKAVKLFNRYNSKIGVHYNANKPNISDSYKLFKGDLRDESYCESLIKEFVDVFGGIDILINNAGASAYKPFNELLIDDWIYDMKLNLFAPYILARNAFNYMKEHNGGKIINISSVSVKDGITYNTLPYIASKAALEVITKDMAYFGGKYNILVNGIRPGFINTPFHRKTGLDEEYIKNMANSIPLRRMGKPKDVANLIIYLSSNSGDFITGEMFTVSGGY